MFEMQVIGLRRFHYKNEQYHVAYDATTLYVTYKSNNVEGYCVDKIFIKTVNDKGVKLGDKIRVFYNRFAKVDSIEVL